MSEDFDKISSNLVYLENTDRLHYLLELAKKNKGISDELKNDDNRIWGCVSTSYLIVDWYNVIDDINPVAEISTDSDAMFVKGLLYLLKIFVNGKTKDEILNIDEEELMEKIGMKNAITSQRINGFYAAIKKLKKLV